MSAPRWNGNPSSSGSIPSTSTTTPHGSRSATIAAAGSVAGKARPIGRRSFYRRKAGAIRMRNCWRRRRRFSSTQMPRPCAASFRRAIDGCERGWACRRATCCKTAPSCARGISRSRRRKSRSSSRARISRIRRRCSATRSCASTCPACRRSWTRRSTTPPIRADAPVRSRSSSKDCSADFRAWRISCRTSAACASTATTKAVISGTIR